MTVKMNVRRARWGVISAGFAALVFSAFSTGPSNAQTLPIVKIGTAPLIAPADALTYYGSPVSPAAPTTRDPLVQELARSLGYNIDLIFGHVRDHVEITPMYGLQKGARGIVLDNAGTSFDQAFSMVEMLREADAVKNTGYNASYVLGQITLTSAQFTSWLGVSDADAARHVLADGGIPATVSGSGSSFSVTMAHVWVSATIGGVAYVFDPSYKPHSVETGVNLPTAMGYSATQLLAAGTSGTSINTSSTIQGFNTPAFQTQLTQYRANLESYLNNPANNLLAAKIDEVVGKLHILAHDPSENRRTSLPYASSQDRAWAGQIPSVYRTSFTVSMSTWTNSVQYFADDTYGNPIAYEYHPGQTITYTPPSPSFTGPAISLGTAAQYDCEQYRDSSAASQTSISIAINHPYAANAGAYMDRTLTKILSWRQCSYGNIILTNDWGVGGDKAKALMRQAAESLRFTNNTNLVTGPVLEGVAAQYSAFLRLAGQSQSGVFQMHDLIGVHHVDWVDTELDASSAGGASTTTRTPQQMLTMDFEAGVSGNSTTTADAGRHLALVNLAVSGLALAESSLSREEADADRDVTSLTLITNQNQLSVSPGNYSHYLATPATWQSIRGQLQSYPTSALSWLDNYIAAGFSLFLPQRGDLQQAPFTASVPNETITAILRDDYQYLGPDGSTIPTTPFRRPTFYAFNQATGDGAYAVYDPRRRSITKGGINVSTLDPNSSYIRKPDAPQPTSKDVLISGLSVDAKSGELSYSPPADLTDGAGSFPRQLTLQRRYDASDTSDHGLGTGWKHSWIQSVSLSNDAALAFGSKGGLGAASALVAIQAIVDLASAAPDPAHLLASSQTAQWLVNQTSNNTATVTNGLSGDELFLRSASGTFVPASPTGAQLVQNGVTSDSIINRRLYQGISFGYTGMGGDQRQYSYIQGIIVDPTSAYYASLQTRKSFPMSSWKFPTGEAIATTYVASGSVEVILLSSATNNYGASLTVHGSSAGDSVGPSRCRQGDYTSNPTPGYTTYITSTGTSVTYNKTAAVGTTPNCPDGGGNGSLTVTPNLVLLNSFSDPVTSLWTYAYSVAPASYINGVRLTQLYKPSAPAPATPGATIILGLDGVTRSISDALGNTSNYFSSPYRSARQTPLGFTTVSLFDEYGRAVATTDALGRTTTRAYDIRDRVVLTNKPEGDSVAQTYDARSNVIANSQNAKPGSALAPILISISYIEGPSVVVCAAPVTCNKPSTVTDARASVTNYAWNSTTGNSAQILKPADPSGARPEIDFAYSGFTGTDGATISLLTSKTEKVSASSNTVTSYTYDAGNHLALTTATVDPAGLGLRTCVKFDSAGNLVSVSDPRTGTCP